MFNGLTMNPEEKKLWVDALRSGKYKQGKHSLRVTIDNYCCLGVYPKVKGIPCEGSDFDWVFEFPDGSQETSLPLGWFMQFFTFDPSQSEYLTKEAAVHSLINTLMRMNDDENKSFEFIANWIDTNL